MFPAHINFAGAALFVRQGVHAGVDGKAALRVVSVPAFIERPFGWHVEINVIFRRVPLRPQ